MKIFHDAAAAGRELGNPWITIGNHDGLHAGHRAVLARLRDLARPRGARTLVVTFRPHPAALLSDAGAPGRLLSDAQQREILEAEGMDGLLLLAFTAELAMLSPEEFHDRTLRDAIGARGIVVGEGFRFGARRAGDVALLAARAGASPPDRSGSRVHVEGVPAVEIGGAPVSSSRIRALVADGRVEEAESLLGRPFILEGRVERGVGRGRRLGFPTANIEPRDVMLPGPGVHATVLRRDDEILASVTNVGRRPTFEARPIGVETHVLDHAGDLYGAPVRLAFIARLRDERRFAGAEELTAQLARDVAEAGAVLARRPPALLARVPGFGAPTP